jgi:flagellar export protein FliJ
MKKFRFPLEQVRAWRRFCWDCEEQKLEKFMRELRVLERQQLELHDEAEQGARRIVTQMEVCSTDFESLDHLRKYVSEEDRRLTSKREELKAAIAQQRRSALDARRQYEAVEKLRERQYQSWEHEVARDEESRIGELTLSRWKRREVTPPDAS